MVKNNVKFYSKSPFEIVEGFSKHSFPNHNHKSFCIGIVKSGSFNLNVNGYDYNIDSNTLYIIPPYINHKITATTNYEYTVLCVNNESTTNIIGSKPLSYISKNPQLISIVSNFIKCIKSNTPTTITNLLYTTKSHFNLENTKMNHTELLYDIFNYFNNTPIENLNYNSLINLSKYSQYHFIRKFKQSIGLTPYEYITQEKIRRIKEELLNDTPLIDLAYNFNFTDQSHFCNTFKRHVGITPLQYKYSFIKID